jgi:hypothetical protein
MANMNGLSVYPKQYQDKRTAKRIAIDELHSFICEREGLKIEETSELPYYIEEFLKYLQTVHKITVRFTK